MLTLFPDVKVELMMCKCHPFISYVSFHLSHLFVLVRFQLPVLYIAFGNMKCYAIVDFSFIR